MGPLTTLRSPQDILAVGIKPHAPEPDSRCQLLRPLQLSVPAKNGLDKFSTRIVAHVQFGTPAIAFGSLEHMLLTHLQQLVEPFPKPFSTIEKVVDEFTIVAATDARQRLLSALDFAGELY